VGARFSAPARIGPVVHVAAHTIGIASFPQVKRPERGFGHLRSSSKVKAVPLQARRCPEGSRKLKFPDFVTTAQDGGRLSVLRTSRLYLQQILLVHISVRG